MEATFKEGDLKEVELEWQGGGCCEKGGNVDERSQEQLQSLKSECKDQTGAPGVGSMVSERRPRSWLR